MFPAKCPTCGANLPVPPGAAQVTCRYCQNVIQIELRKGPINIPDYGGPLKPSRTLYVDPEQLKKSQRAGALVFILAVALPILLPILLGVGPWALRTCKGIVKPFPVSCATNGEVTVSGKFESTGPLIESAGHNCKIHIKNSTLKGSMLVKTDVSNLVLTIDDSTIETTDTTIRSGSGLKLKIHRSTIVSVNGSVIESATSGFEVQELEGSTLESKTQAAVRGRYNIKIHADASKIRGKKAGIDADSSLEVTMKKASEITSSDGPAIQSTSSFKLEADSGKIDGATQGILTESGATIVATGLAISGKEDALKTTSGGKLDFTDGSITSQTEAAIAGTSGMKITLSNAKVSGPSAGIMAESSLELRAVKKTRIVATTGNAVNTTSSSEINLNDSSIEGGSRGIRATSNLKLKLLPGARVAGKKGGLDTESNITVDATGATLEGGSGPALEGGYSTKVSFKSGVIKGNPALLIKAQPVLELDGTRIEGEQKIGR